MTEERKNIKNFPIVYLSTAVLKKSVKLMGSASLEKLNTYVNERREATICYVPQKCYLVHKETSYTWEGITEFVYIVPSMGHSLTEDNLKNPKYKVPIISKYDFNTRRSCENALIYPSDLVFNSEKECQKYVDKENAELIRKKVEVLPVKVAIEYGEELKEKIAYIQDLAHMANNPTEHIHVMSK